MIRDVNSVWFKGFLEMTARQWGSFSEETSDGVILVDLSHDWLEYILYSLLIAKFIQRENGSKIIGYCFNTSVVKRSCPNLDTGTIQQLAKAHGVHDVVFISSETFAAEFPGVLRRSLPLMERLLRNDYPTRGFGSCDPGIPPHILTCAYESALRASLVPSCENFDRELFEATLETRYVDEVVANLFSASNITAVVTGHLDYNPWRLICHYASLNSVPIYNFFASRSVSIWRLKPTPGERFGAAKARANAASFSAVQGALASPSAELIPKSPFEFVHRSNDVWAALSTPDVELLLKHHFLRMYPWRDEKPVVTIFAHTFSDIPSSDKQVFRDHAEWLKETLAFASHDAAKNWVVRPHPLDKAYDRTGFIDRLQAEYAEKENIYFIDCNRTILESVVVSDLIITVRGTIGVEATAAGVPCVLAGAAPYSSNGFSLVCLTREEYFSALSGSQFPTVTPEERRRAAAYLKLEKTLGDVQSEALPAICSSSRDERAYFQEACERLSRYSYERDPFVEALRNLNSMGEGRALWPLGSSVSHPVATVSRREDSALYFTPWRSGLRTIVDGFHAPDEAGSWSSATTASILLPASRESVTRLTLTGRKLAPWQEINLRSQSGELLSVDWIDNGFTTIELDVAGQLDGAASFTLVELQISETLSPAAIGLNGDARNLGFCLHSIGISHD